MLGLQRFAGGIATQLFRRAAYSSAVRPSTVAVTTGSSQGQDQGSSTAPANADVAEKLDDSTKKPKSRMVAAAFEALTNNSPTDNTQAKKGAPANITEERILNAKTVNGLLSVVDGNATVSRKHALKVVSILAEWSTEKRVKLSEFENDPRFLRLCRLLGRNLSKPGANSAGAQPENAEDKRRISGFRTDDLNTVLGVAGDDEAAKLIASISLPQMVRVMTTLAQRKRRSTPLLRSLAFNISSSPEQLNLKQCADVLYAMAVLNFQDSVLAAKTCVDVQATLPQNKDKSAVVGSILTSLGILKYRDLDIMESLTQWLLAHNDICRPQDHSAYFLTASTLNFKSANIEEVQKKLTKSVLEADFQRPYDWLNHVWALTLLRLVHNQQIESVLW